MCFGGGALTRGLRGGAGMDWCSLLLLAFLRLSTLALTDTIMNPLFNNWWTIYGWWWWILIMDSGVGWWWWIVDRGGGSWLWWQLWWQLACMFVLWLDASSQNNKISYLILKLEQLCWSDSVLGVRCWVWDAGCEMLGVRWVTSQLHD